MSNRASLRRTQFIDDDGNTGWGWRICDDYFRGYTDHHQENDVPANPLCLLLKACAEATEEERILFEELLANGQGLLIGGSWHEFEDIAPVLRAGLGMAE